MYLLDSIYDGSKDKQGSPAQSWWGGLHSGKGMCGEKTKQDLL